MNDAHWHIVVNHFPIVGAIFGLLLLITGFLLRNSTIKSTAYSLFIVVAIFSFISMSTGESAEHMLKGNVNVSRDLIHTHEELAEKFALVSYVLGVFSLIALVLNIKKNSKFNFISYLILVLALVLVYLSNNVGNSGGEVIHTEIRSDNPNSAPSDETVEQK
ncbi:MAG: hypothetical protein PSV16_06720 [Flavobacterium sp.]|nr:hypothetical protein [Flavobacterium sp.]